MNMVDGEIKSFVSEAVDEANVQSVPLYKNVNNYTWTRKGED